MTGNKLTPEQEYQARMMVGRAFLPTTAKEYTKWHSRSVLETCDTKLARNIEGIMIAICAAVITSVILFGH